MDEPSIDPDEVKARLFLIGLSNQASASLVTWLPTVIDAVQPVAFLLPSNPQLDDIVAGQLRGICAAHKTAFLVQDDLDLANHLNADGVHATKPDRTSLLRSNLAKDSIIGADVGESRHDAMCVGEDGADYVAFGQLNQVDGSRYQDLVAWWRELFTLPSLAYADDPDRAGALARAGADFIGVASAIWDAHDSPVDAAGRFQAAIDGK